MKAEVKVRCSEKMHKIVLNPNGQLSLANHTKADIEAMKVMNAFDPNCKFRCMSVLRAWQKRDTHWETETQVRGILPELLFKIWELQKHWSVPVGMGERLAKLRGEEFLDFTSEKVYYPELIKKIASYQHRVYEKRLFAMKLVVDEFKRRNLQIKTNDPLPADHDFSSEKYRGWVGRFVVIKNQVTQGVQLDEGNGAECALTISMLMPSKPLIICNDYIQPKIAADLIELYQWSRDAHSLSTKISQDNTYAALTVDRKLKRLLAKYSPYNQNLCSDILIGNTSCGVYGQHGSLQFSVNSTNLMTLASLLSGFNKISKTHYDDDRLLDKKKLYVKNKK